MKKTIIAFAIISLINLNLFSKEVKANEQFNSGLQTTGAKIGYDTAQNASDGISARIAIVTTSLLTILGILFIILMIYGGAIWMNARGNDSEIKRAQAIIRNTIIGVILVLTAYAITTLIQTFFDKII